MKLFQYVVLWHPTEEQKKKNQRSEIIVPVKDCVAPDEKSAMLIAGRAIPDQYLNQLDQCEVAVRPF